MTKTAATACQRCGLSVTGGSLALCPRCLLKTDDDADADALPVAPPGLVLEAAIGSGGMGRVFRGRHVRLDRPVAVKFLPADLATDPGFEARFEREARLLAQLAHPNIVGVYDSGVTSDGQSYLVMEYVAGGTLADRLPVSAPEAIRVAIEICVGLQFAHDKGMVHRDIKPENILFDADGKARVADFGIARLTEPDTDQSRLTRPTLVLGTPAYLAPEAYAGAPPDPRMDVYAMGVMLHQMIAGRLPVGGVVAPDLPPSVASVIAAAVALDPARRPASAGALGRALQGAAGALVVPGRVSELPPEEQSWQSAVALVLAGATAVALYAFLVSFTPRTLHGGDALPLVSFGNTTLPDGRILSQARFETWPVLAAAGAFALALAAYGLLRRHWRHAGLDVPMPDQPLTSVRATMGLALVINGLFVLRFLIEKTGLRAIATYTPVIGGVLELYMVYRVWNAVLDARRVSRPLRREPLLWAALGLALVPPVTSFLGALLGHPR